MKIAVYDMHCAFVRFSFCFKGLRTIRNHSAVTRTSRDVDAIKSALISDGGLIKLPADCRFTKPYLDTIR